MYICYLFEIDANGNKKLGSIQLKLPVIPRIGDYLNISLQKGEEALALAGIVKDVDMYCSIEESDSAFSQEGIPEPKEVTWYIAIGQKESKVD